MMKTIMKTMYASLKNKLEQPSAIKWFAGEVLREDCHGGDVEVYAQSFDPFFEKLIDERS
ncbi:hypothetical protein [Paenibacillus sp. FSL H8-0537]|uniref:hypothetical protein n=1 Tax=Paenibacillus sp. FSL H8-0537 TaxID=2921399 RepID=UPI003100F420